MALDVGAQTIGIALSDPLKVTARPLKTLPRRNLQTDLEAILDLASEHQVKRVVIGLPVHLDGQESTVMAHIRPLADSLRLQPKLEIVWQDERLSTREAEELMSLNRVPVGQRRKKRNEYAAAIILERYLRESGERH